MPGQMTITGLSAGNGEVVIGPITTVGTNTLPYRLPLTLATGDNVVAVPSGMVKAEIELGTAPAVTVKVRTNLNSGDAGLEIAPSTGNAWSAFDLPSGVTEIILNASGSQAAVITLI